jgi:hypothetical protein
MMRRKIDDLMYLRRNHVFWFRQLRLRMARMPSGLSDIADHPLSYAAGNLIFPGFDGMGFKFFSRYNCRRADKRVPFEFVFVYRGNTDVRVVREILVGMPLVEVKQIDGPVLVYLDQPFA